jgi:hypothetical protein
MALQSMTALASITLQEASASVSFSGIPEGYRDLVLAVNSIPVSQLAETYIRLNNDAGNNYTAIEAWGDPPSLGGTSITRTGLYTGYFDDANRATQVTQIIDYSATNKHKTALVRLTKPDQATSMIATRWANTSPVTSLTVFSQSGSYAAGSTFNLYGRIA